jgi:hypothetical protein
MGVVLGILLVLVVLLLNQINVRGDGLPPGFLPLEPKDSHCAAECVEPIDDDQQG